MLVQFSVQNYRSLKGKMTLSLLASSDKERATNLISAGNKKQYVPVTAIYGANSSGKSNILMAMCAMQDMITGASAQLLKEKKLPHDPFMFAGDTQIAPTEFEIIYYYGGTKYAYGFSYNTKQILTEGLYHWPNGREALVFSRKNGKYEFRDNIHEQSILAGRTPANKLYLVSSNEWNAPQTELAYKWFVEKLQPYNEHDSRETTIKALMEVSKKSVAKKVINEMMLADLGISNVDVVYDRKLQDLPSVFLTHKTSVENDVEQYELPLEQESKGTQRFFARIGPWMNALELGGVLVVDEIEASLHPMLTRRLVEMIQDPNVNTNHAQLVFTTHDVNLLDLSLLRRDQIWFTDKDPYSLETELFSLWDFSVRKRENIRKGYLQGRYGAIPFIGGDVNWLE